MHSHEIKMENRGYEDDNRYPNDHHQCIQQKESINNNNNNKGFSDIEGHIYEDISIHMDKQLSDNHQSVFKNHLNMNNPPPPLPPPWLSDNNERSFQRNLTLPLRRDRSGLTNDDAAIRYSVRIPSNDRNSQYLCDNFDTSETSVVDTSSEKPSRRRRKKDCKHCKMKTNDDITIRQLKEYSYDESRSILEPIFTLPNGRIPNLKNTIGALQNNNNNNYCNNSCSVFTISNNNSINNNNNNNNINNNNNNNHGECQSTNYEKKTINYDKNDVDPRLSLIEEDRALLTPQKHRTGMKVNSIYSPDQWRIKDTPVFIGDFNQQFQRAYSLPDQQQSPSSQNRVNLRRSVRGEPPPQPAQLSKNRHGWTLHFARSLDATNCTRSIILLLIVILALLGIGSMALYIVFEPEKLQIIQQYLRSGERNNSALNLNLTLNSQSIDDINILKELTTFKNIKISTTSSTTTTTSTTKLPLLPETTTIVMIKKEEETITLLPPTDISPLNVTRHCDDCYDGEVCVALAGEEVPICRIGPDPKDPTGCSGLCLINRQKCHRLDTDAFRCVEVEHYCLDDEWTCSNTLCIPSVKRCDGHMNCYDHSDEYNCACDLRTHFQCGNETSCLPIEKRCDGKIDCWDATDEMNCTLACPSTNEFTCSSGQCIQKTRFCDGLVDCSDGSDEPHGCQGRCNKHEFTCGNGRCITRNLKCNGIDDCGDRTDEKHCRLIPRRRKK